jgi:spoIIIJ-associated protein
MGRRITTTGGSILDAVSRAVAELADCDLEKVDVRIDAPGLVVTDEATVELQLRVDPVGAEQPAAPEERRNASADATGAPDARADAADADEGPTQEELDEEADAAADFIEGLLDVMDLPGDLRIRVLDDHAEVELVDVGSGALIGRRGQTLESIQELLRCAMQREFQRRSRVQVDIEGYRARRLEKLIEKAEEAIEDVLDSGEAQRLEPMDVFERKAVHHLVAEREGVASRSQGREPGRRVIIEPAD